MNEEPKYSSPTELITSKKSESIYAYNPNSKLPIAISNGQAKAETNGLSDLFEKSNPAIKTWGNKQSDLARKDNDFDYNEDDEFNEDFDKPVY